MYILKADQPLTRRKSLHHVLDEEGGMVYSSGKLGPCIAWLHLRGEHEFLMEIEAGILYPVFLVKLIPIKPDPVDDHGKVEALRNPEKGVKVQG